jgi:opacity protein-like surface antigen
MRRSVFLAVLMLAVLFSVAAQDVSVTAGAKGGLNLGWFSGDDWDDFLDARDGDNGVGVGLTLGGFVELEFTERFGAQPEILFFQQKGKASYEDVAGDDVTQVTRINTLQIPMLAKATFAIEEGAIYGIVGPSVFLTLGDAKTTVEVDGSKESSEDTPDNRLLFGLAIGAGYEYPVGAGELIGELRYTRVLSRYEEDLDTFGNTVSLLVGYGVPIE